MNLRRAAIGILTAGGLTIGLAIGFGPLGARGQQSGPPPQPLQQPVLQQANVMQQPTLQQANPFPGLNNQQAGAFPSLINKQIPQYPPPVVQGSAGYVQQFTPLAQYMRPRPQRPSGQQGYAVPANAPGRPPSSREETDGSPIASWRTKQGADDDETELVPSRRTTTPTLKDDDEIRPASVRGRPNPFDDEDATPPGRPVQRHALSEAKEPERRAKTDDYGSDLFTKGNSDPYIQYASFAPVSLEAPQRLVNSKKISLQYQVRNAGPSGVALVEVWRTCDGRKWEKFAQQTNAKPPFVVEVEKEGLYGFILIPRSGVGLARKAPVEGEAPQLWVEVDLSPPQIKLNEPVVGTGRDNGKLTITWTARDRNLGSDPITISYAEEATGEWKLVASRVRNSGKFVWQMPPKTPYRFLVRVHAVDRAGNVGSDQTANPVVVDLATPETVILGADPISR